MSLFGRKTFRVGPLRLTLSRSGISESVGGRRVRVRLSPKAKLHKSVNLGHGFRWTK